MEEPCNAELARAQADKLRLLQFLPVLRRVKFFPGWRGLQQTADPWQRSQTRDRELRHIFDLAVQRQHPPADMAPCLGRRVHAVGAGALRRYQDLGATADNCVGGDLWPELHPRVVTDVWRWRQRLALPGLEVCRLTLTVNVCLELIRALGWSSKLGSILGLPSMTKRMPTSSSS